MPFAYPLMLDVTDRLAVIIGGGAVASRKARRLIEAGAGRLRIVAAELACDLPENAELIREPYRPSHLDGAGLVFAATDSPLTNEQVVRDARGLGVLVCRADEGAGDFVVPASFQEGELIVSVSAGSPALSASIRDDLRGRLDRRFVALAAVMRRLRPRIRASQPDPLRRAEIYRHLAGPDALGALENGIEALDRWIVSKYPDLKSDD